MDAPAAALDYEIVDVFAPRAFAGNPLAVVFDADDLAWFERFAGATMRRLGYGELSADASSTGPETQPAAPGAGRPAPHPG